MSTHTDSTQEIWKTYGIWVALVSLAFFPTYPVCNWITAHRTNTLGLYFDAELAIPFVPQFIWAYFSMYVLFLAPPFFLDVTQLKALGKHLFVGTLVASLAFLLIPTHLGFIRAIPADPFYQSIFSGLFVVDQPHNMVPSLHIVFTSLIVLSFVNATSRAWLKIVWLFWLGLIMASTALVHQHHLTDIVTGGATALLIRWRLSPARGISRAAGHDIPM